VAAPQPKSSFDAFWPLNLTAGGNNFNDFAENLLTCVSENISLQKIWRSKYHV